jgi:predicted nucleic acid-binding protein
VAHKANVTLTIDSDLLREARILAAEEGTSVSGLLRRRLEELVRRHKAYDIQASGACGAETLYSEDHGDGQVYDSVRVVSPFGPKTA